MLKRQFANAEQAITSSENIPSSFFAFTGVGYTSTTESLLYYALLVTGKHLGGNLIRCGLYTHSFVVLLPCQDEASILSLCPCLAYVKFI